MKFARYLQDTQIPEWKRAYIDYRGLKKRIAAIRAAQQDDAEDIPPSIPPAPPVLNVNKVQTKTDSTNGGRNNTFAIDSLADIVRTSEDGSSARDNALSSQPTCNSNNLDHAVGESSSVLSPQETLSAVSPSEHPGIVRSTSLNMGFLPRLVRRKSLPANNGLSRSIPLKDLIPTLTPVQKAFFEKLDSELDKVETFYVDREKEMRTRTIVLKSQLEELQKHRRIFHEAEEASHFWLHPKRYKVPTPRLQLSPHVQAKTVSRKRRIYKADSDSPTRLQSAYSDNENIEGTMENPPAESPTTLQSDHSDDGSVRVSKLDGNGSGSGSGGSGTEDAPKGWKKVRHNFYKHKAANKSDPPTPPNGTARYNPDEYLHAKKSLKKAVLECYRGLEALENYRTLNMIGFRKALKKFEKITRITAQQAYLVEKVEPSAFSSGDAVKSMLGQMEELYAEHFTRGDNKLAKTRLRGSQARHRSRHLSVFWSGLMLGIALPAFVDAIYLSFQPETRQALPGYAGLLYVFSVFLIPVLFVLLVGVNILGWHEARINYVFIFEFDLKTKTDHREFFEIPTILLSTLSYALWLSFSRVGSAQFSPTLWPLIWLAWVIVMLLNPLPIFKRSARWWFLRNLSRQLTSGVHRVEFADFWMGDQYCSLIYPISNLYLVACAYSGGLDQTWSKCLSPGPWGVPFLLASIPLLVRLVQSVKRWVDSGLITHLINGGKYGTGIIYYLTYYIWRHHGGGRGGDFVLWCIFGTIYAIYASAWDLLMDWSLLRPHAKFPLLRQNVLYTGSIPLYYFAIITNVFIRFVWVMYIPQTGPPFALRTFIAGMLEMLRRWQWNFYRLENEHLGNVDQYRVTREVPLPYNFDDAANEMEADDDDRKSISSWRSRRRTAKMQAGSQDVQGEATS